MIQVFGIGKYLEEEGVLTVRDLTKTNKKTLIEIVLPIELLELASTSLSYPDLIDATRIVANSITADTLFLHPEQLKQLLMLQQIEKYSKKVMENNHNG